MYRALAACGTCKRSCTGDPSTDTIRVNASSLEAAQHLEEDVTILWRDSWKVEAPVSVSKDMALPREANRRIPPPEPRHRRTRSLGPTLLTREAEVKSQSYNDRSNSKDSRMPLTSGGSHPLRRSTTVQEHAEHAEEGATAMALGPHDDSDSNTDEDMDSPKSLEFGAPIGRSKNTQQLAEEAQEEAERTEEEAARAVVDAAVAADAASTGQPNKDNAIPFSSSRPWRGLLSPLEPVEEEVDSESEGSVEGEKAEAAAAAQNAVVALADGGLARDSAGGANGCPAVALTTAGAASVLSPTRRRHSPQKRREAALLRKRDRLGGRLWRRAWHRLQADFKLAKQNHEFKLGGA